MASDYAARAATAAELIKLRDTSEVIFTARVNQATPLTDTDELTYDGGTGTYTDIKSGMLVWVGSAAGKYDRGVAYIRTSASTTKIYTNQIGFTFADNDYITVKSVGRQSTTLGLAIQHPDTIYTARINQTFATLDGVTQLTYDGGSGTLIDILVGMTVFIGTSAGASDKGFCRIRKLPTATILYINQTSDVVFDDDDYITVVDSFSLWPRDIAAAGDILYMDYDIAFNGYAIGGCLPRIAPIVAVIEQASGTLTFTPPSPALTTCYDGATISSYSYDAPGALTTANMTAGDGTASWTYPLTADGEYRWSCAITDSLGRITTSYRWVFVNPSTIPFKFEECVGDVSDNGWSFTVTVYDDVTKSSVYDRALCTLYADDRFFGVSGSIGKLVGYENIICTGWIDGESITYDSESGAVTFTVRGAASWLSKIRAFPFELQDTTAAAANWKQIQEMTVDKALFHLLFWTTTAPLVMDCFLTGNTTRIKVIAQPSGNLLDQMSGIALNTIWANPLVNNLGQLYIEVDSQMLDTTGRAALDTVMEITEQDRTDEIDLDINTSSKTAMLELGAISDYDGSTEAKVFSRAPGNSGRIYGGIDAYDNYNVVDQDDCNAMAGRLLSIANNPYEQIDISLAQNNRLFDIAPLMYGQISIIAADNPRGVEITDALIIPRKIEYIYDDETQCLFTNISFEFATTSIKDGITYVPPTVAEQGVGDYKINTGNLEFPDAELGDLFPDTPVGPDVSPCSSIPNSFTAGFSPRELVGDGGPLQAKCYFPCKLRAAPMTTSKININMTVSGDAASNYTVSAFKAGAVVATGSVVSGQPNVWEFTLLAEVDIDGFQIDLASGIGSVLTYIPLDIIGTGSVTAVADGGTDVAVVDGNLYSIEATGGPWHYQNVAPEDKWTFFNFWRGSGGSYTGGIGRAFANGGATTYYTLGIPTGCLYTEVVNNYYGRTYFYGDVTEVFNFCVSDFLFTDNAGALGYILRNAEVIGRKIELSTAIIQNVCSAG